MFYSYLKISFNLLFKHKLYSFINIVGLAVGLAACILIGLFVQHELSYDKFYTDAGRIYRVSRNYEVQNLFLAANAPRVAPLLKQDFPEIEAATRLFGGEALLGREDKVFYEKNVRFADPELFKIFDFNWLAGNPETALVQPNSAVLTEAIARKYFGREDPMGATILLENSSPLQVTGIIEDLPENTHLSIDILVPLDSLVPLAGEDFLQSWGGNNFHTYIKLFPGVDIASVESQFEAFLARNYREDAATFTSISAMPLTDIHLHSTRQFEMKPPGTMTNVIAFTAIALFILLIASFNFMNLATARSAMRGQEIGVRKSIGASRGQLVTQFLGESLLLVFIAAVLSLMLVELVLPVFNGFLGLNLSMNLLDNSWLLAGFVFLVLFVGLFSGSYPAFYLSSFKPSHVLKSVMSFGGSGALFRNILVIIQFSIAVVLVVCTFTVAMQMKFARNIDLGFVKDQVVVLHGAPTAGMGRQWETMKRELLRHPGIAAVTASDLKPLDENTNSIGTLAEGETDSRPLPMMQVGYDFFETYQIPLLAGRTFSEDFADVTPRPVAGVTDEAGGKHFIINRTAAALYGWSPEEAVGKGFQVFFRGGSVPGNIVGVVEDSHFESVRKVIKPMLFFVPKPFEDNLPILNTASLRLSGYNPQETLQYIDETWKRFMPQFPVSRQFLDEDFEGMYRAENQQQALIFWFSVLSIAIACLGLYGLASYNAERRFKEIGIRKVMGGSVWQIVMLLTNDFSRLVLISNIIAWPVAYFAMNRWLSNFAYRIDLTPLIFIGSGLIALCIAWVTVGGTAAKAASQKPVLALRYE